MRAERTCWAEGSGLSADVVEELTLIAEEADRRGGGVDLATHDLAQWSAELDVAGYGDLADRVRAVADENFEIDDEKG